MKQSMKFKCMQICRGGGSRPSKTCFIHLIAIYLFTFLKLTLKRFTIKIQFYLIT